jgi:WD40 repeat protein
VNISIPVQQLLFLVGLAIAFLGVIGAHGTVREITFDLSPRVNRAAAVVFGVLLLALGTQWDRVFRAEGNQPATLAAATARPVVSVVPTTPPTAVAAGGTPCENLHCDSVRTLGGSTDAVRVLGFDVTGQKLLSATASDPVVSIWQMPTSPTATALGRSPQRSTPGGPITAVSWDPVGGGWPCRLASGWADGVVALWDDASGSINWQGPQAQTGSIQSLAWNWRGIYLASGSDDGTVAVWAPGANNPLLNRPLTTNFGVPYAVAWRPSSTLQQAAPASSNPCANRLSSGPETRNELLAAGTQKGPIVLWDPLAGELIGTLPGHAAAVHSIAWSPDGTYLASASDDQSVRLWNLRTPTSPSDIELLSRSANSTPVNSVAWSRDGRWLASGSADGTVRLWRLDNDSAALAGQLRVGGPVLSLAWGSTQPQNLLAIGRQDKLIDIISVSP